MPRRHVDWLWKKHGLEALYVARDTVYSAMLHETIPAILRTKAEGLFGIGVKLAAMPTDDVDGDDYAAAVMSVQKDIDRLLGTNFADHAIEFSEGADE